MTHRYIGTKEITAWEEARDQPLTGRTDGYAVRYEDGYTSWSPKETFESAYRVCEGDSQLLNFGDALHFLKQGKKVARAGWNGKGMWLVLIRPGNAMAHGFSMQPCIGMKTANGVMQPGWLCSQNDMLAEDWGVV